MAEKIFGDSVIIKPANRSDNLQMLNVKETIDTRSSIDDQIL